MKLYNANLFLIFIAHLRIKSFSYLKLYTMLCVEHDEKEIREYKVDQLRFKSRKRKRKTEVEDAELKKLEALEKKEGRSKLEE